MRLVPSAPGAGAGGARASPALLHDKIDDVTRYIQSHTHVQHSEVGVGPVSLALGVPEAEDRIVTVMHPAPVSASAPYPSHMCRQVSLEGAAVLAEGGAGGWPVAEELMGAELMEEDGRLEAALVAVHLAHAKHSHPAALMHHQHIDTMPKVTNGRHSSGVEQTVLMDVPMRLFNNQNMGGEGADPIVVEMSALPSLPPLQDIKSSTWYHTKTNKESLKEDQMLSDTEHQLELSESSPAQTKQSRKSLPHKKRISRKLRRPGATPRQDMVLLSCGEDVPQEEILPDSFVASVQSQPTHMHEQEHHLTHEVRPMLICQICGEFYGEEQLKFYQHLKQHYEPHGAGATIIIENPVSQVQPTSHLSIDKMTTCIVDNVAPLPEALVELSLENTVPNKMSLYHNAEKHILYTSGDKTLSYISNKCTYSTAIMEKEEQVYQHEAVQKEMYEDMDKEVYTCTKCNKSFRKQKLCEAHIKEAHTSKVDEMSEFSEPEDLMEGIHVLVEGGEGGEVGGEAAHAPGGFLTVDNGHVHQDHMKHWYLRSVMSDELAAPPHVEGGAGAEPGAAQEAEGGGGGASDMCAVCSTPIPNREALAHHMQHCPMHLKEEVLQRILESEVGSPDAPLTSGMMLEGAGELHTADSPRSFTAPRAVTFAQHAAPARPCPVSRPFPAPRPVTFAPEATVAATRQTPEKKVKVFECQECSKMFKHRNSLLYHIMSHNGKRPHKCLDCEKGFYTAGALKVHMRVHSGDKPYKCTECDRDFRQWGDLKYHVVSIHSTKKNYKCDYCAKEFARKYSLNIHIKIHTGERNYKCEYCTKTFRASSYRLVHMRTHTGERPFKCEECGKRFRSVGDLKRHIITHTKFRKHTKKPPPKEPVVKFVNIKIRKHSPPQIIHGDADEPPLPAGYPSEDELLQEQFHDGEWPKTNKDEKVDMGMPHLSKHAERKEPVHNNELLRQRLELKMGTERVAFFNFTTYSHSELSAPRNVTPFEHLQRKEPPQSHLHISNVRSYATKSDPGPAPAPVPAPESEPAPAAAPQHTDAFLEKLTALYSIQHIT